MDTGGTSGIILESMNQRRRGTLDLSRAYFLIRGRSTGGKARGFPMGRLLTVLVSYDHVSIEIRYPRQEGE